MKRFLAITALTLAASGAHAQSMGSIPQGFEISGNVDFSYAFDGGGSGSLGFGDLSLGYRHDINSDLSVTVGVRAISAFGDFASETQFDFYGMVGYRNFQFSYGAIDNAVARFDWDFISFENQYFNFASFFIAPIGLHPELLFANDVIRVDAQFGNVDMSASYSDDFGILSVAGEMQFGNTRVLGAVEYFDEGDGGIISLGANHAAGAFEFGGVIGFVTGDAPFDFLTRVSATYHVNDDISLKAVYAPAVGGFPIDQWELSATYEVNDLFSIGASAGRGIFGGDTVFGINASAHF